MPAAISTEGLTKVFHTTERGEGLRGVLRSLVAPRRIAGTAVDDVSFQVEHGELLALLGPNGAGKSTIIKMLTGILTPTSGRAEVVGVVPYQERLRNARTVGAVFGQRTQLWWDLPARESFAILRDIYDIGEAEHRARLREFDDLLDLSAFWDTRVRHLSLGQRVRCDLAAALLHDPPVIFLDEPTIGMDIVVKEQVRRFLRHQVKERGRTVLLTTHDMTEVAHLAERIVLINHGRIVHDGSLEQIRRSFGGSWVVRATVTGPADARCPEGLRIVRADGNHLAFGPDPAAQLPAHEALRRVVQGYDVTDLALEESDFEDVMRAAYLDPDAPDAPGGGGGPAVPEPA
ncbi:ATP-binding cassette domain-containing protein [Streptomyces sp. NPDC005263]|uniref:ABC transporter ATP-binding protein n=1 Tax=Streptomyces sp. NPDC005263 TaxID=3364711 RepID=UPI00368F90A9